MVIGRWGLQGGYIDLYKTKPDSHEIIETSDYFESWFIKRWKDN
jgi:hypothetical protein